MINDEKAIKTMTLDLAKTLSYLSELAKTNNQNYVTKEGMALLEGIIISGNGKVKVMPEEFAIEIKKDLKEIYNKIEDKNQKIMMQADIIRGLKDKPKKKGFKLF